MTFQSGGLQSDLNRLAESSSSLEKAAGEAVGGNGRAQSVSIVGLKETESGANGKTVQGGGETAGRPGAAGLVGGLGRRANVQINAGSNAGESFRAAWTAKPYAV